MTQMKDRHGRPVVVVTGMGVVTSLGQGKQENWAKLTAGQSGIHTITRFPIEGLRTTIAGTVDFVPFENAPDLTTKMAALAGDEAVAEAGIALGAFPGPLFLGMPPVELEWPQRQAIAAASGKTADITYTDILKGAAAKDFSAMQTRFLFGSVSDQLADRFGTKGAPISISTACATGATAIQLAVEAIRRGETGAALVVSADGSANQESLVRFSLLSALSTRNDDPTGAARPFSKDRDGFVMAEGAGALVLESYEHAKARGATILGVVEGCGEMADSFHRTRSSPDGAPIIGCIQNALEDAGVTPADVQYVNAHGTSTPENDKMEYVGLAAVFGEHLAGIAVSSNKSMIGHTLSAAGAIEAVFTLMTINSGVIPPTINHTEADPAIKLDLVPNTARKAKVTRAISSSFGFGGQNVCLVLAAEPT
ncbi:beta-ketoacyl-ACP synthase [Phreatobacter sp.]|uniref:beta-ketoacyl-ACP synthase n=1 Tax=Phreatobacter sp. TaxID=1966341 RepID=UPI0022BBD2AC|nr:beta-ketoacyl-ACP synthase [Phreatobacter sp.]MCZ8316698.1 beta-ketoacyl-ACP synthase [Phreatobacter sp.]